MGYLQALYETYNSHLDKVGEVETKPMKDSVVEYMLLPVSHTTQTAHIEMTIGIDGTLLDAEVKKVSTILPFTEESGARAGANYVPHVVHDKLMFVAGDYAHYTGEEEKAACYDRYIEQLGEWCASSFRHPHIEAIYQYVKKGTVIRDLVEKGLLVLDDQGKLLSKWTNKDEEKPAIFSVIASEQQSAFIRFNIHKPGVVTKEVWRDQEVFKAYTSFYEMKLKENDLCYVMGQQSPKIKLHPNKIRNSGDKSKLISANDTSGFTFKGRFHKSDEAANISYDVSQKAHNALKWLIEKQGKQLDGRIFLVWGNNQLAVPNVVDDLATDWTPDFDDYFTANEQPAAQNLQGILAGKHRALLDGLYQKIEIKPDEKIYILLLDAATPGRLAVLYFREFDVEEYFTRLLGWHTSASWKQAVFIDKKRTFIYGSPSLRTIAEVAYGPRPNEKVVKGTMERLLPCILDGRKIPLDIVKSAIVRASNPQFFEHGYEWERALGVTCSLVRKTYEKEAYKMALDTQITDRDYLYGRLLAVADVLERSALGDEDRATSAIRYMNAFQSNPERTWNTIQKNLQPYLMKLRGKSVRYTKIIDEIGAKFEYEAFNNKPLSGKYLLGFYSQRQDLYTAKDKKEEGVEVKWQV